MPTDIDTYIAERRALLEKTRSAIWSVHPITQLNGVEEDSGRTGVWIDGPNWVEADEALWFDSNDAQAVVALRNDEERQLAVIEAAVRMRDSIGFAVVEGIIDGNDFDVFNVALDALIGEPS